MSARPPVRAVGVLVPARDEQPLVGACLDSVLTALEMLPADVAAAVCLVVDRSRDATAPVARRTVARRAGHGLRSLVDVRLNSEPLAIGAVRNQAARVVLDRLAGVAPSATWLLSTDADGVVPPDWALRHVELADAGADAVSGRVHALDGPDPAVLDPDGIYAANLGVRAAPFLQVGGFPPVASGEDAALLRRVRAAGFTVLRRARVAVRTSMRPEGRAPGGLAEVIRLDWRVRTRVADREPDTAEED